MKFSLILLILSASFASFGAVVTSADVKNGCVVYRVTSQEKPRLAKEGIVEPKELYGLTIKNMHIDFNTKSVSVEVTKRIVLAFDRPLIEGRVFIRAENPNFDYLVNQLNRDLFTFDKVCITPQHELIWATMTVPPQK